MPRGRPLKPLELSPGARAEIESLARSRSLPAGLVRRAQIVLLCAGGVDNKTIADRVGTGRHTVGKWRERFRTQGLMGLYDERRPGKPRSIEDEEVMALIHKTLDIKPPDGSTHWSCRSMADAKGSRSPPSTASGPRSASSPTGRSTSSTHRSVLRREDPRHRRTLPQPARRRDGPLRRRKEPDAGAGANRKPGPACWEHMICPVS